MPDVPGRPQHDPMCADETMMKWLTATLAGKKPDIDRVGLSYMLLGEARQGQGAAPAKGEVECGEVVMITVSVMYANTPGARFDHTYLIKARLGNACKHYSVDKGLAGEPAPYVGQNTKRPQ